MARDRANLRIDLWGDEDWRKLSMGAQHIYILILSHSTLNYAGVADWRPGRLAALTAGRTPDDIRRDAQELSKAAFIYADEVTEEVLVRSFLRHDGVIKHPRLHVSMAKDYAGISSSAIKAFVAFELQKLNTESPTLALWDDARVQTILKATPRNLKGEIMAAAIEKPCSLANPLPKELNSDPKDTTTATTTTTETSSRRSPETRIPDGWKPNQAHADKAAEKHLDVKLTAEAFRNHAEANDRRARNWDAAFRNWILKATPGTPAVSRNITSQYAWANK